jgi:hypothetical protein
LKAPEKLAVFRGEAASSWGSGGTKERLSVLQRDDSFESEVYVPVWTSQLYVNEWWSEGGSPVRVTVVPRRDGVHCRLENVGEVDLSELRMVIGDRVYELGDLPAGESSEHTLLTANGRLLPEVLLGMGAGNYHSIISARGQAFGAATSGRIDDIAQGCFVASFLNVRKGMASHETFQVQPGLELTSALRENAVLLAFAEGQAVEPSLKEFRASRGQVSTVWRVTVPFTAPDKP